MHRIRQPRIVCETRLAFQSRESDHAVLVKAPIIAVHETNQNIPLQNFPKEINHATALGLSRWGPTSFLSFFTTHPSNLVFLFKEGAPIDLSGQPGRDVLDFDWILRLRVLPEK